MGLIIVKRASAFFKKSSCDVLNLLTGNWSPNLFLQDSHIVIVSKEDEFCFLCVFKNRTPLKFEKVDFQIHTPSFE